MTEAERDRKVVALAEAYLLNLGEAGITPEVLARYLGPMEAAARPEGMADLFCQLLSSAASGGMRAGVIAGAIGGVARLGPVLGGFDPGYVVATYGTAWEPLLDAIERQLQPSGKVRRTPRSSWPLFCRSILDGAAFLAQFRDAADFFGWADSFYADRRGRLALPLLLEAEIYGVGFALLCDFLKELGYTGYAKPDVHLHDIFSGLALCPEKPTPYQLFKAIDRVAGHAGRTAYAVDKLFWLIGSGHFYDDPQIGRNGKIGRQKAAFVAYAREALDAERA